MGPIFGIKTGLRKTDMLAISPEAIRISILQTGLDIESYQLGITLESVKLDMCPFHFKRPVIPDRTIVISLIAITDNPVVIPPSFYT